MQPANYWRLTKENKKWLGKTGVVEVVTIIRSSSPEFEYLVPYGLAIVSFGAGKTAEKKTGKKAEKKEFLVAAGETVRVGDKVKCVLRKMGQSKLNDLLEYGVKIIKTD